jgi:hypothetical protein
MLFKHTTNEGLRTNQGDQSYVGEHFLADCLCCVLLMLRVLRYPFPRVFPTQETTQFSVFAFPAVFLWTHRWGVSGLSVVLECSLS